MRTLVHAGSLVTVVVVAATLGHVPSGAADGPEFVVVSCPEGVFPSHVEVDCGFVRVPEDRSDRRSRTIEVHAAVVRASGDHPEPDPIVLLDGGPSFGAISDFALGAYLADSSMVDDRDLILVDTRGTGISEPRLGCPELDEAEVRSFYSEPFVNSDAHRIARVALRACWDRLVAEGVDPAAYTSAESAADLDALRRALGVDQWNLLALSADGVLGETYLRLFPDGIRSAVFDSAMSSHMTYPMDFDRGRVELLEKVFAECRANQACRARYPGIRSLFYEWVDRLQADPVIVTLADFRPEPVRLEVDGIGLLTDAPFMIYPGDPFTPSSVILDSLDYIWRVTHGEIQQVYEELLGTGPLENGHLDDFFAQGKTLSYVCHDLVGFTSHGRLVQAAHDIPPYAPRYLHEHYDLALGFWIPVSPAGCDVWDVGRAPGWQNQPVRSDIPTLVLAGEYDVGVPPYIVRQIDDRLSRATYVELPASAHLQLAVFTTGHECAREITAGFLADPLATVDLSCVAEVPRVDFAPPT